METDKLEFESLLNGFMELLDSDNDLYSDFNTYFRTNYLKSAKQWAMCYRVGAGINTNNYIEAFHAVFKAHYLFGKKNKRLDTCLHALLKYARDIIFKRARKIVKNAYTLHEKDIDKRHQKPVQMDVSVTEIEERSVDLNNKLTILNALLKDPDLEKEEVDIDAAIKEVDKMITVFSKPKKGSVSREPANKKPETQFRFYSKKKRTSDKITLSNPDTAEVETIKKVLRRADE